MDIPGVPPVVLITGVREPSFARAVAANGYAVAHPPTAALALERAREARPDLIIVGPELPDSSPIDVCRLFHHDPHIGGSVPILILAPDRPTPQQRVIALEVGAWDFVRYPGDLDELSIKLQSYVQAKRNIDAALADRPVDPPAGLHDRAGLARRARELGALLGRQRPVLAARRPPRSPRPPRRAGTIVESRGWVNRSVGESGVDVALRLHVALQLDRQLVEVDQAAELREIGRAHV